MKRKSAIWKWLLVLAVLATVITILIVYIKNTLQLGEIWVSDALIEEVRRNPQLILCDEEQSIEKLQMS